MTIKTLIFNSFQLSKSNMSTQRTPADFFPSRSFASSLHIPTQLKPYDSAEHTPL